LHYQYKTKYAFSKKINMKQKILTIGLFAGFLITLSCSSENQTKQQTPENPFYLNNRAPLRPNPYIELPIGAVKAEGWLREMLIRQKNGTTGHLDEIWPEVMGSSNNWVGGDGDRWERGPYWLHGMLTLAYLIDDDVLIEKAKPWIEWSLQSQQDDGFFGPADDREPIEGITHGDRNFQALDDARDWWPRMVMLKVFKNYYSATSDERVIDFMTRYFRYQLNTLPEKPLDNWRHWGHWRGGDNLMVVYWLYNITGDDFLLDLAELIHQQTVDYNYIFNHSDAFATQDNLHCVNVAQGIKEPIIYYQQHQKEEFLEGVKKAFRDIQQYMGHPHGLYGGDEGLRNKIPTTGSELCTAVEMMYSLENMLMITGDPEFADQLEKIAFNALPAQISDDFMSRQYYQQANQIKVSRHRRNFSLNHRGTDILFGLFAGYTCCTANMHQGWPEFTRHLWFATPDKGVASLVYAPSSVTLWVADSTKTTIIQDTNYPFEENIRFTITFPDNVDAANFPFHVRIPGWSEGYTIKINGDEFMSGHQGNQVIEINREWKNGDKLELELNAEINFTRGHERSVAVNRGPLTYALKMGEKWIWTKNEKDPNRFGEYYWEVHPTTPWNYGLIDITPYTNTHNMDVVKRNVDDPFPWNQENVPIEIRARGRRMVNWLMYNEEAGPLPYSNRGGQETMEAEDIVLIPYGATTLRISAFPVIGPYGNKRVYPVPE
jgi:DUF1680 family protein